MDVLPGHIQDVLFNKIIDLKRQLDEAREVIKPFANIGGAWPDCTDAFVVCSYEDAQVKLGDLRRAREWLKANGEKP